MYSIPRFFASRRVQCSIALAAVNRLGEKVSLKTTYFFHNKNYFCLLLGKLSLENGIITESTRVNDE